MFKIVSRGLQENDQLLDEQIAEALACPCVDDLRSGPCGKPFEASFSCFLRHHAKNKVTRPFWQAFTSSTHAPSNDSPVYDPITAMP